MRIKFLKHKEVLLSRLFKTEVQNIYSRREVPTAVEEGQVFEVCDGTAGGALCISSKELFNLLEDVDFELIKD